MKLNTVTILLLLFIHLTSQAEVLNAKSLLGAWKGIDVFQDENSYDGRTFYLPNEETVVFSENMMSTYYYPYSKIDDFKMTNDGNQIRYKMSKGYSEAYYKINGDTLQLEMHFINKVFIKVYKRYQVDQEVIAELDKYGFNPSSIVHEMELDTFHLDQAVGFENYDSLTFKPYQFIQFVGDDKIKINRGEAIAIERGYNTISFTYQGALQEFTINHSEGTQSLLIIPNAICNCHDIIVPYMTVSWADRIREAIRLDVEWD